MLIATQGKIVNIGSVAALVPYAKDLIVRSAIPILTEHRFSYPFASV